MAFIGKANSYSFTVVFTTANTKPTLTALQGFTILSSGRTSPRRKRSPRNRSYQLMVCIQEFHLRKSDKYHSFMSVGKKPGGVASIEPVAGQFHHDGSEKDKLPNCQRAKDWHRVIGIGRTYIGMPTDECFITDRIGRGKACSNFIHRRESIHAAKVHGKRAAAEFIKSAIWFFFPLKAGKPQEGLVG